VLKYFNTIIEYFFGDFFDSTLAMQKLLHVKYSILISRILCELYLFDVPEQLKPHLYRLRGQYYHDARD
jgi:hypothetical protein